MKKKRVLSLLCVIVIILITAVNSTAKKFNDVSYTIDPDMFDAINYMSDNGYMSGTTAGLFNTDGIVTRGMFIYLLYVYGGVEGNYITSFMDVNINSYYYNAIGWAQANGIVSGNSGGTFNPNGALTRQDLFVILHNFAADWDMGRNIDSIPSYALPDLEDYTDQAVLSSYAEDPMKWAIYYNVYVPEGDRLYPIQTITRGQLALYFHKYEMHIRSLVFMKDIMPFTNSAANFDVDGYHINQRDYSALRSSIECYYGANDSRLAELESRIGRVWTGSSYGMYIVSVLDKLGILAVNENYDTNKDAMCELSSPKDNEDLQSIINAYQILYEVCGNAGTIYKANRNDIQTGAGILRNMVKNKTFVLFTYFWNETGVEKSNSIIIYDSSFHVLPGESSKTLVFYGYDCMNPTSHVEICVKSSGAKIINTDHNVEITGFQFESDFDFYRNYFDYDGAYNNFELTFGNTRTIRALADTDDSYVKLVVPSYMNFTIENSENETISVINGNVSGDMKIYSQQTKAISNHSMTAKVFVVDTSDSFTLISNNSENSLEIYGDGYDTTVRYMSAGSVKIEKDGIIELDGGTAEFEVMYPVAYNNYDFVTATGVALGNTILTTTDSGSAIIGVDGDILVEYIDYDTYEKSTDVVFENAANVAWLYS